MGSDPTLTLHEMLGEWSLDLVPTVGVAVAGLLYVAAYRRLAARTRASDQSPAVPRSRTACFGLGLAVLIVAVDGPPDVLQDSSFSMHMIQHLLLQMVAPPLLLLAGPALLVLRADPPWFRRRLLARALRSAAVRFLTHPVTTLLAFSTLLVGSHLSPLYELTLRHEWVHELEHMAYFTTALLFWWVAIGVDPAPRRISYPARLFYLFLSMPVPALLGLSIASSDHVLYPYYLTHVPPWGTSALQDQHLAGFIMWNSGIFTIVPAMAVVLLRWLDEDARRQARKDRLAGRSGGVAGFEALAGRDEPAGAAAGGCRPAGPS
jgi:cytochrome c oxidase assembly factor CtaG